MSFVLPNKGLRSTNKGKLNPEKSLNLRMPTKKESVPQQAASPKSSNKQQQQQEEEEEEE